MKIFDKNLNITRRNVLFPSSIFVIAVCVRLILFYFDDGTIPTEGDAPQYLAIAQSLKQGTGFSLDGQNPTASRMPLYPIFISGILFFGAGTGIRTIQLIQIIIDSCTCFLGYFLTKKLLSASHGFVCGIILALYIPLVSQALLINTETIFTFFLILSVLVLVLSKYHLHFSAFSGFFMGITSLIRPNGVIIGIFLFLWIMINRDWNKTLRYSIVFLTFMLITISPWIVRNTIVFKRFIPTCTLTGLAFYNSYIIPEKGLSFNEIKPQQKKYFSIENENDRSRYLVSETFDYIINHPVKVLKLVPIKLLLLIYPYDFKWLNPRFPFRYNIFWGVISLCALCAFVFCNSLIRERLSIIIFLLGALLFVTIIFYGSPRLRSPYDPYIVIISSIGINWIWNRKQKWFWIAGLVCINFALLFLGKIVFSI